MFLADDNDPQRTTLGVALRIAARESACASSVNRIRRLAGERPLGQRTDRMSARAKSRQTSSGSPVELRAGLLREQAPLLQHTIYIGLVPSRFNC
jgi:hypothetical protein